MDEMYRIGFADGYRAAQERLRKGNRPLTTQETLDIMDYERTIGPMATSADTARFQKMYARRGSKPKRKLSKWQKFVKANSKKKQFIYQSGAKKGKLNLKKMGIAYRRKNK